MLKLRLIVSIHRTISIIGVESAQQLVSFDLDMKKRKKEKEKMGLLAQHTWPFKYGFFIVAIKSSCIYSFCLSD